MWTFLITMLVLYMYLSNKVRAQSRTGNYKPLGKDIEGRVVEKFGVRFETPATANCETTANAAERDDQFMQITVPCKLSLGEGDLDWDKMYGKSNKLPRILFSTSSDYNPIANQI